MAKKNKRKIPQSNKPVSATRKQKKVITLWPWLLGLSGLTVLCFFPMLKNNFTNWDDEFYVVNNALLLGPDWAGIFSKSVVSNYHPITVLSLALNYAVSGTKAWSYLLFNLLLHVANIILVFRFIYSISGKKTKVAFLTALVFGIHPMHVESVAWISERKDVLYTLFFLLALMQYWRYLYSDKQKHLWFCFLLFVFSILSKPAAIILPLVLFLLDYSKQRSFDKKAFLEKIPFFLIAGLFVVITLKLQSVTAMSSLDVYPLWVRFFFACYVGMIYFIRFFVPYPLSAFHPFPPPDNLGLAIYLSPIFLAGLLFFLWRFRKNRVIVFGFLFFLVNIALVLQLISIGFTIVSERYTYLSYVGLAFMLFMTMEKYITAKMKVPARVTAIIVFSVFGYMSFQRTKVWNNSDTLWTDVIDHYPNATMPRGMRAQYNFNKAILMNLSETDSIFQRVIEDCTVSIENDIPSDPTKKGGRSMHYMRANAYNTLKQYDKALEDFNTCISINPDDHDVLYLRGALLVNYYKRYDEALSDFNRAIQASPQGRYYLNRSICYYRLGDLTNARADAQAALGKGVAIPDNYRQLLNL